MAWHDAAHPHPQPNVKKDVARSRAMNARLEQARAAHALLHAMFTGIVEETGTVVRIERGRTSIRLAVRLALCARGLKPGDSVDVSIRGLGGGLGVLTNTFAPDAD